MATRARGAVRRVIARPVDATHPKDTVARPAAGVVPPPDASHPKAKGAGASRTGSARAGPDTIPPDTTATAATRSTGAVATDAAAADVATDLAAAVRDVAVAAAPAVTAAGAQAGAPGSPWLGGLGLDPRLGELARLRDITPMYDAVIDEVEGRHIRVGDDWLIDFASCNYLGFDLDPEIISAAGEQVRRWGTHPGWSRLLGSPRAYPQIEERLSELLGAPDTLLLPTITHIHLSVIPALAGRGHIFMDSRAHKTVHDGCVHARALGATVRRFRSGDLDELTSLLKTAPAAGPRLVCMDGVDSMTGNVPDIAGLARLCREHGAVLYVDDAHGFGVLGERRPDETSPYGSRGNSVVRYLGESYDNLAMVGGFSKAYSSLLAFVAVPILIKEHLKIAAAPYLYSGPSPTASLAGVLAGLDVNERRGDDVRATLYRHCERVLRHVRELGLSTPNVTGTPIIELPLAQGVDLADVAASLWRRGIYLTLAAYPLVPRDQVGVRVMLTAAHTAADVDALNRALTELAPAFRRR